MKQLILAGSLGAALVIATAANAADLAPAYKAPLPASAGWTGCYVGGHAGWGFADPRLRDTTPINVTTVAGAGISGLIDEAGLQRPVSVEDDNGVLLGAQIGCDYQFGGNYLVGISASAAGADINGDLLDPYQANGPSNALLAKTDFLGDISGRLGMIWRQWLLYGKGGVAWSHNTYTVNCGCAFDGAAPFRASDTPTGAVVGAGVEWRFAADWSAFVEYDHYFFDTQTLNFVSAFSFSAGSTLHAAVNVNQSMDVIKAGANFHFN